MSYASSATGRVLAIPELFENILSTLSKQELEHGQLVSKQWRQVVSYPQTKELKQALWISGMDKHPVLVWNRAAVTDQNLPWQPAISVDMSLVGVGDNAVVTKLHSLFEHVGDDAYEVMWPESMLLYLNYDFAEPNGPAPRQVRRNLVTQPPSKEVNMSVEIDGRMGDDFDIYNERGVTVGDVIDKAWASLMANPPQNMSSVLVACHVFSGWVWDGSPWVLGAESRVGGWRWKGNVVQELDESSSTWQQLNLLYVPNFGPGWGST